MAFCELPLFATHQVKKNGSEAISIKVLSTTLSLSIRTSPSMAPFVAKHTPLTIPINIVFHFSQTVPWSTFSLCLEAGLKAFRSFPWVSDRHQFMLFLYLGPNDLILLLVRLALQGKLVGMTSILILSKTLAHWKQPSKHQRWIQNWLLTLSPRRSPILQWAYVPNYPTQTTNFCHVALYVNTVFI